ncbi:MAG TPA: hypothetical protein VIG37_30170 [Methylomirabilota bacterium]|jgi:hypothetical protein
MFGTAVAALSLLVMVMEVPTLHHHPGPQTGLYDQECPTMRLAASAGGLGLAPQSLTDLGAAPPAPDTVSGPPMSGVPGRAVGPTDPRGPPSSS